MVFSLLMPEAKSQHHHHHHDHHHRMEALKNLIGALSFEHSPIPFHRNHHQVVEEDLPEFPLLLDPTTTTTQTATPGHHLEMPPDVAHRSSLRRQSLASVVSANAILYGTLDPDGRVQDIFYDAHEFGDCPHDPNQFVGGGGNTNYNCRDSILVAHHIVHNDHDERTTKIPRGGDSYACTTTAAFVTPATTSQKQQESNSRLLRQSENDNNDDDDDDNSSNAETKDNRHHKNHKRLNDLKSNHPYWDELPVPPAPPKQLPLRFLRAGKGDLKQGMRRYQETLAWRRQEGMDTILREPVWHYQILKQHYPSYYHMRGKQNECCYYEQPPKTNLKALRDAGITLDELLRYYAMVTEFQWQHLERDDLGCGITIIDVQGIRMGDFVGEVKDFVLQASQFCGQHYPERAGFVFVINVPAWFQLIFSVVKPFIDPDTLEKIRILRGADQIQKVLEERIPIENIPPEYGGSNPDVPLGKSPQEELFAALCEHNNAMARGDKDYCNGPNGNPPCQFCSFRPARSY